MWSWHTKWVRCYGPRFCEPCAEDPNARPHGPYWELKRRYPGKRKQPVETLHIGNENTYPVLKDDRVRDAVRLHLNLYWATGDTPSKEYVIRSAMRVAMGKALL